MIRNNIISKLKNLPYRTFASNSSSQLNLDKLEEDSKASAVDVVDDEVKQREAEIERKRNKSRLRPHDRRFVLEETPHLEPKLWIHGTVKYLRRTYGRYGMSSGVDPALCWPTESELKEKLEYERVAFPYTIPQLMAEAKRKKEEKLESVRLRQEEIVEKMQKLDGWKKELFDRIEKKEGEALAAKERKERLVEEVRRHFGYTVDPRDEKFKEMLEKKEKEQKKLMKEARKKAKEEKAMAKLLKGKEESKKGEDKKKNDDVEEEEK